MMKSKTKNKFLDYNLVIWNDPLHSMNYVVEVLTNVIPNTTEDEAIKYAYLIHTQQKAIVYSGMLETTEHFADLIERYEPENREGKLLPSLAAEIQRNTKKN